jgi:predicted dehydrogenase
MKIGFIGGYGHHYLRHLLRTPGAGREYSVAVAGDGYDTTSARGVAEKIGVSDWFETPQQLFDEFCPEVVSIGAMYGYNGEVAALALERNIAVVSDKPVAATWHQLRRLQELTQETPRVLLTEFPFRSQREFRAARMAVKDGRVGEVILAIAQKSYRFGSSRPAWYANRNDYGGTMLWVASHGIDVVRFVSGQNFNRVIGVQGNLSRPDYGAFEDHCVAMFELANGGHAVVHADFLRPDGATSHGDDRLRIAGSKGVVEVLHGRCRLTTEGEPETDITDLEGTRPVQEELLAALRGESREFYSTQESLEMAEILLHAREAADIKQWVDNA